MDKLDYIFILRGRPGLGHVIPGLSIALALTQYGQKVGILTYECGVNFLKEENSAFNFEFYKDLQLSGSYQEWPGLCLYNHGVRVIGPYLERYRPRLCIFGGEYLSAPLPKAIGIPGAMIFNPEIMEDNPRNFLPSNLFCHLFKSCDHLIPLYPINEKMKYLKPFESLKRKLTPSGPYCFPSFTTTDKVDKVGRTILIANGGGIAFPSNTESYSETGPSASQWLEETITMTFESFRAVINKAQEEDSIFIFSCLTKEDNERMRLESARRPNIKICSPSFEYYKILGTADLIISRAGGGFIADARTTSAKILLWTLSEHEEQLQNANELEKNRAGTKFCRNVTELHRAIEKFLNPLSKHYDKTPVKQYYQNSNKLAKYLIEHC